MAALTIVGNLVSYADFLGPINRAETLQDTALIKFIEKTTLLFTIVFLCSLFFNRWVMIVIWIVAFNFFVKLAWQLPELKIIHDNEVCADINICHAGIILKSSLVKGADYVLTRQTCLAERGTWLPELNSCDFNHTGNDNAK